MFALEKENQEDEHHVMTKNQESLGSWTAGLQQLGFKLRKLNLGFNQL